MSDNPITIRFLTARTFSAKGKINRLGDFKDQLAKGGFIKKWRATRHSQPDDLALFYFGKPRYEIVAVGRIDSLPTYGKKGQDWEGTKKHSHAHFCSFKPVWLLENPIFLSGGTDNPTIKEWWAKSPARKPKNLKGEIADAIVNRIFSMNPNIVPLLKQEFKDVESAVAAKLLSIDVNEVTRGDIDFNHVLVDPPSSIREKPLTKAPRNFKPRHYDFAQADAKNRRLGRHGEQFVIEFERSRLKAADRSDLAARVEWVSETKGDGAGYDIASFETGGEALCIEVKTTNCGKKCPFIISDSELEFAKKNAARFCLYRVFSFLRDPKLFILKGALEGRLILLPKSFEASF